MLLDVVYLPGTLLYESIMSFPKVWFSEFSFFPRFERGVKLVDTQLLELPPDSVESPQKPFSRKDISLLQRLEHQNLSMT